MPVEAHVVLFKKDETALQPISGSAVMVEPNTDVQEERQLLLGTVTFWNGTQDVPAGVDINNLKDVDPEDLVEYQAGCGIGYYDAFGLVRRGISLKECALGILEHRKEPSEHNEKQLLVVAKIKGGDVVFVAEKNLKTGQIAYGTETDGWKARLPSPLFGNNFPCIED